MKKTYRVHLISATGSGSYYTVKGRAEWQKTPAIYHATDIAYCTADAAIIEVVDNFGSVVWSFTRPTHS